MKIRNRASLAVAAAAALLLTACGSDSLSGEPEPAGGTPAAPVTQDADLSAKLPEKIKTAGKIVVGTDSSYAPNEFTQGNKIVGMDVDLFNAVAAKFGVEVEWQSATFATIITGVNSGKYDVGVSSFTINDTRKKEVNMVSYYSAGTQWASPPGNPKGVDPEKPCGKTIAVQTATVQQLEDLPAKQKACGANKINILPYDGQDKATAAVASGKADAMLADSPIAAYAVKQSGGKLELLGDVYDSAPYGYTIPKDQTEFAQAIADALTQLEKDGGYQAALAKWGVEGGAITDFAVNP